VVQELNRTPGKVHVLCRNDHLGPWQVLHPEATDHFPQADDNALVLATRLGSTRVLLLSDLGRAGQNVFLERTSDLRADIVVGGLPSASEALADWLLDAIQPRLIIVADSEFPATERASPALRERLARRKVPVIYTRSDGAATIDFTGHSWELRTMTGVRIRGEDLARPR
jgi:beta-lactamase superfamily II metal-dependent hydrolase